MLQQAQIGMNKIDGGGIDTNKKFRYLLAPFNEMPEMYDDLNRFIQRANLNHFGFDDIRITENAQFTEYTVVFMIGIWIVM